MKMLTRFFLPVAIVGVILIYVFVIRQDRPLEVFGEVNAFELLDENNQNFGAAQLKNKVWAVNFIFTTCQGVCPTMTKNMAEVQKNFEGQANVNFVSISVNPETDTPEILSEYRKKHNVTADNWHFLTGDRDRIKKLMFDDMKLGYSDDVIFHSDRMVLVDGNLKIRGYYTGTQKDEYRKLSADINRLISGKSL